MGWRHVLAIILLLIAAAAGGLWYMMQPTPARLSVEAVMGPDPRITPALIERIPGVRIADVVGWSGDAKPTPAAGLAVGLFAKDLVHPRWMTVLPNGDVLVAESGKPKNDGGGFMQWITRTLILRSSGQKESANRITLLRDADGDGSAETRHVLIAGLNSPFGMALVGSTLYIANTDALVRVPYTLGQTRITAKPEKVVALNALTPNNHWARNVIANEDGSKLYVTVGSNSNIGENGMDTEKYRANILEVDVATKSFRVYAAGLRNPNGLAWQPRTKTLWTTVNERDMLGPDLPPDYLAQVDFGAHYGWPHAYWGGYEDVRVEPKVPNQLQYFRRPEYALGPHTASLGLAFANGPALGANFASGAFIGQHGSWNRSPPAGYKVIYVPFGANGYPDGKAVDVLTGFLDKDGDAQGRPAGVAIDARGALLVADDSGNRIWRVTSATPRAVAAAAAP